MKFQIKHEIKGRIRFHVVQKKQMTCEQADILLYYLENMEGVESVKVYDRTADAVVCYKADADGLVRKNIIKGIQKFVYEKVEVPDGPNRYDFTLKNHYHVRCVKCGEVSDVDMDEIPDLMKKIHDTHGIEFLDYDISFKGICPKCRKEAKVE